MKSSLRTVGLASACLIAVPFVVGLSGSAAASAIPASPTVVPVTSLGAAGGTSTWNVSGDSTPGATDAISAVTDPTNVDGSLHLATPLVSDRGQVTHSLLTDPADPTTGLKLADVSSLSFATMVATTATNPEAPTFQFSMLGCDTTSGVTGFTTLNFEPSHNTAQGTPAAGTWNTWNGVTGMWWSTKPLNGLNGKGGQSAPVPWTDILTACANGHAYESLVSLGSGAIGADAYADNVNLNGTTWDFATPHQADVSVSDPAQLTVGDPAVQFDGTVTNPADGPDYSNARYDFSLSGISGLKPADVALEYKQGADWLPITLTASGGTLTGSFGPHTGFPLPHGLSNKTTFRIAIEPGSPTGAVSIDNKLVNVDASTGAVITTIAEHTTSTAVVDQYTAVTPTRVVDTRVAGNALNEGPLVGNEAYTLDLTKLAGVPLNEAAYVFNVTAVQPTGPGNLRIAPACASTGLNTSIVNYQPHQDVANDLVVSNLVDGVVCNKFTVYNASAGAVADVVMDLQGYFSSASGFVGTAPTRVADTRTALGGIQGPIAGGSIAPIKVGGTSLVPSSATAVAINITAVGPGGLGNLRVYPDGQPIPTTSNVNYIPGSDQAAFAMVKLPADGVINVYSANSSVNVVIDVFGYLPATTNVVTQSPVRVLDTRTTGGALVDGTPRTITVGGATGSGVPANAKAVIVSLTAVHAAGSTGVGNLQAYAGGTTAPVVSNINYLGPNADVANMAIVPLSATGTMTLATHGSTMNAVVDVVGYIPAG